MLPRGYRVTFEDLGSTRFAFAVHRAGVAVAVAPFRGPAALDLTTPAKTRAALEGVGVSCPADAPLAWLRALAAAWVDASAPRQTGVSP
jgi:hypothetical protein